MWRRAAPHSRARSTASIMSQPFRKAAHKLKKLAKHAIPDAAWNVYRGDRVVVTRGRDRGQTGVVRAVDRKTSTVVVAGVNVVKKHARGRDGQPGQIVAREAALRYANVALADPANGHPVRVTRMFLDDGTKVRVSRGRLASGSVIPMPEEARVRKTVRKTGRGPADATKEVAARASRGTTGKTFAEVFGTRRGGA
jgi:large subunit ribosomal protein L24